MANTSPLPQYNISMEKIQPLVTSLVAASGDQEKMKLHIGELQTEWNIYWILIFDALHTRLTCPKCSDIPQTPIDPDNNVEFPHPLDSQINQKLITLSNEVDERDALSMSESYLEEIRDRLIGIEKEILNAGRETDVCDGLQGGWDVLIGARETVEETGQGNE